MRKLIDIKPEDIQPLKIMAVKANKDLKNYIQDLLSEHAKPSEWGGFLFVANVHRYGKLRWINN